MLLDFDRFYRCGWLTVKDGAGHMIPPSSGVEVFRTRLFHSHLDVDALPHSDLPIRPALQSLIASMAPVTLLGIDDLFQKVTAKAVAAMTDVRVETVPRARAPDDWIAENRETLLLSREIETRVLHRAEALLTEGKRVALLTGSYLIGDARCNQAAKPLGPEPRWCLMDRMTSLSAYLLGLRHPRLLPSLPTMLIGHLLRAADLKNNSALLRACGIGALGPDVMSGLIDGMARDLKAYVPADEDDPRLLERSILNHHCYQFLR